MDSRCSPLTLKKSSWLLYEHNKNPPSLTPCAVLMFNFMIKFTFCFTMVKAPQGDTLYIPPIWGQTPLPPHPKTLIFQIVPCLGLHSHKKTLRAWQIQRLLTCFGAHMLLGPPNCGNPNFPATQPWHSWENSHVSHVEATTNVIGHQILSWPTRSM